MTEETTVYEEPSTSEEEFSEHKVAGEEEGYEDEIDMLVDGFSLDDFDDFDDDAEASNED